MDGSGLAGLRARGQTVDDALLQYLLPLGWEHINLTSDRLWRSSAKISAACSGAMATATGLACFIFRFLRQPLVRQRIER